MTTATKAGAHTPFEVIARMEVEQQRAVVNGLASALQLLMTCVQELDVDHDTLEALGNATAALAAAEGGV